MQEKISVAHEGVDTEIIRPNENIEIVINRNNNEIRLNKSNKILTYVSRTFEPIRGYHHFMRSLPTILQKDEEINVLIVGGEQGGYGSKPNKIDRTWKEKYFNEIKEELNSDQLNRIIFLDKVNYADYLKLLQISKVHIYFTYPFVLSWSLLEAMSVGCAIVASKTKPVQEVIQNNINGRLVNFFDVHELVYQVCDLLQNEVERQKLGNNARISAVASFDLESVCLPKQLRWVENLTRDNTF